MFQIILVFLFDHRFSVHSTPFVDVRPTIFTSWILLFSKRRSSIRTVVSMNCEWAFSFSETIEIQYRLFKLRAFTYPIVLIQHSLISAKIIFFRTYVRQLVAVSITCNEHAMRVDLFCNEEAHFLCDHIYKLQFCSFPLTCPTVFFSDRRSLSMLFPFLYTMWVREDRPSGAPSERARETAFPSWIKAWHTPKDTGNTGVEKM